MAAGRAALPVACHFHPDRAGAGGASLSIPGTCRLDEGRDIVSPVRGGFCRNGFLAAGGKPGLQLSRLQRSEPRMRQKAEEIPVVRSTEIVMRDLADLRNRAARVWDYDPKLAISANLTNPTALALEEKLTEM